MSVLSNEGVATIHGRVRVHPRGQTVLRVSEGGRFVGDILLDGGRRLRRRADTIPSDIVLKVLIGYTRQEEVCGRLIGLNDGRTYLWHAVGALPAAAAEVC